MMTKYLVRTHHFFENGTKSVFAKLEMRGVVFLFPMNLDFSMLLAFPESYGVHKKFPEISHIRAGEGEHSALPI
jgi:hypothetical protein